MGTFALLAACICIGLSSGEIHVKFGDTHHFRVPSRAEYLQFEPADSAADRQVLWSRSRPEVNIRGTLRSRYEYEITQLTQADNGEYVFRTRSKSDVTRYKVTVSHHEQNYNHAVGEALHFDFHVEPRTSSLIYTNVDGDTWDIVTDGSVTSGHFGRRLKLYLSDVFSVDIEDLSVDDSGVYEIKDYNNNLALKVHVEVAAIAAVWTNVGFAAAIVSVVVSCCCCVKRCCCKKSSRSSDADADAEPTESPAHLLRYSTEPPPPQYSAEPRPPATPVFKFVQRPAAPPAPSAATYSPASVPFTAPPSQTSATGGPAAAPEVSSTSYFLCPDTDPHFEMKGLSMPLSSEVSADVYTSDKLNFSFL